MENNNKKLALDPFISWSHNFGRAAAAIIVVYMFAVPTIICAVFNCFPAFKDVLTGALPIIAIYWPVAFSEVLSYTPVLGSSSYLTFITGNVVNLKLPCAINAQKLSGTEPNTPEGDAVALLANSVSSLVTMGIIILGMLLMIPLKPLLETAFVQTAVSHMLPAMFGCLVLGFLVQDKGGRYWIKNKLLIPIVPFLLTLLVYILVPKAVQLQGVMVILSIAVCLLIARLLWKKGVVKAVTGPDAKPYEG